MQSRNIKTRLTHLTWLVTFALMFLLIPINIFAQLYLQHQAQRKAATQMFGQLTQLIETNKTALEREKDLFAQQCIRSADVVAYFWEHYPIEIIDLQHTRDLADKLDLDEIHFLTCEQFHDLCPPSFWFAARAQRVVVEQGVYCPFLVPYCVVLQ